MAIVVRAHWAWCSTRVSAPNRLIEPISLPSPYFYGDGPRTFLSLTSKLKVRPNHSIPRRVNSNFLVILLSDIFVCFFDVGALYPKANLCTKTTKLAKDVKEVWHKNLYKWYLWELSFPTKRNIYIKVKLIIATIVKKIIILSYSFYWSNKWHVCYYFLKTNGLYFICYLIRRIRVLTRYVIISLKRITSSLFYWKCD